MDVEHGALDGAIGDKEIEEEARDDQTAAGFRFLFSRGMVRSTWYTYMSDTYLSSLCCMISWVYYGYIDWWFVPATPVVDVRAWRFESKLPIYIYTIATTVGFVIFSVSSS